MTPLLPNLNKLEMDPLGEGAEGKDDISRAGPHFKHPTISDSDVSVTAGQAAM